MPAIEVEKSSPDGTRLRLVRGCAESIEPDHAELQDWMQSYAHNHCRRIALDLELVERYSDIEDVIVEFGSIPLILTASLKSLGYNVQGIDIDPSRFSSAISKWGLNIVKCNVETESLPLDSASCDVVIFNELFEHLRINPIFTIGEVHRILKPGGTLLLSTPNLRSVGGIVNFLVKNKAYSCSANIYEEYMKLERLGHMGHVREYTTREVTEFLTRLGFQVEAYVFRGRYSQIFSRLAAGLLPGLRPFVTYVARAEKHAAA